MTKKPQIRFLLCVRNDGYPESLELRKLYRVLPDFEASKADFVRVVDESGGDYLYPKAFFVPIRLAPPARKALAST